MDFKLLVLVLLIKIVVAIIRVDVNVDNDQKVNISYTGTETRGVTEDDLNSFNLGKENFDRAFTAYEDTLSHFLKVAIHLAFSNYSNCEDVYKNMEFGLGKRVLSIKSASVKSLTKQPVVVVSQDFENSSNRTIKVNTGISHSIENTLTTSWSEQQLVVSQDVEYEINLGVVSFGGKTDFSFTTTGGVSGEKSKTETIGTTNGMEVELKPGDAVTAVLSATVGYLEMEVVHKASLQGLVCHKIDELQVVWIERLMTSGGIKNEVTATETIKIKFYVDAQLKVHEKKTELLIF